jgi:hypothetical protein
MAALSLAIDRGTLQRTISLFFTGAASAARDRVLPAITLALQQTVTHQRCSRLLFASSALIRRVHFIQRSMLP